MRLCGDSFARHAEKRRAPGRIPLRMDLTQVEAGEDGGVLDHISEVGTGIYILGVILMPINFEEHKMQRELIPAGR